MLAFLDYKYPGALEIEDPDMFERLRDTVRAVTGYLEETAFDGW
ncbi:hypothetical protein [Sphingobium sp. B11D3D]|nr:hypothetical protein [Sphingobium sp. B11D3D]MCW2369932.1 hypothetical protein [Sphingobium sp. B11D3D]